MEGVKGDPLRSKSHENVFVDCGFSAVESESLEMRADLMIALRGHIRENRVTQAKAAKMMGVSQPRVSDLMRGRIELFSVDMLIRMLSLAGLRVEFRVKPVKRGKTAA